MMNERIDCIIRDICPFDMELCDDSKLKEDLGVDSLRLVELLVALEEELSIEFSLSDLDVNKFSVVSDIYDLVNKYVYR